MTAGYLENPNGLEYCESPFCDFLLVSFRTSAEIFLAVFKSNWIIHNMWGILNFANSYLASLHGSF